MKRELLYVDKVRITARPFNQKARITSYLDKAVKSGQRVLIKRAVVTDMTGETQRILIGTTKPYRNALFLNEYPAACCGWDGQETDLSKTVYHAYRCLR